ncbi:hypothetical protein HanPI659440_Chr14g0546751 [Helianthus annuus]|nr:hypothetical protein HanPI659440_Chr14g0546751 [Helianthus annuus]
MLIFFGFWRGSLLFKRLHYLEYRCQVIRGYGFRQMLVQTLLQRLLNLLVYIPMWTMVIADTFAIFVVLYFGWKSEFNAGCLQAALVIINVVEVV